MGGTVCLRASLCYLVPEFCLLGKRPVASGPVLTSVGWVRPRPHLLPTEILDTSLALWLLSPSLCPYLSLLFPHAPLLSISGKKTQASPRGPLGKWLRIPQPQPWPPKRSQLAPPVGSGFLILLSVGLKKQWRGALHWPFIPLFIPAVLSLILKGRGL